MSTFAKIYLLFLFAFFSIIAFSQNCNTLAATGTIAVNTSNTIFNNGNYFAEYQDQIEATFTGTTSGGVLNYILHFDTTIVNNYSIINSNFNSGIFNETLPVCQTYYISAVYGFDNNIDGIVDDIFDACSIFFTSDPIQYYFPINIFFPTIFSESCFNNETQIQYYINGGLADCLDNDSCQQTYTINSIPDFCPNNFFTYIDPVSGDSIFDIGINNLLIFDVTDIDGTTYNITKNSADNIVYVCPIELLNFEAIEQQNKIELNWQTATEFDNDFFTINKSLDGENFETIAIVNGNGTTKIQQNYFFYDEKTNAENIYYQLVETDFNGNTHIVANTSLKIDNPKINTEIDFYLHNKSIYFNTLLDENLSIEIFDLNGKVVFEKHNLLNKEITLPNNLSGLYVLKLKSGQFEVLKNFVF